LFHDKSVVLVHLGVKLFVILQRGDIDYQTDQDKQLNNQTGGLIMTVLNPDDTPFEFLKPEAEILHDIVLAGARAYVEEKLNRMGVDPKVYPIDPYLRPYSLVVTFQLNRYPPELLEALANMSRDSTVRSGFPGFISEESQLPFLLGALFALLEDNYQYLITEGAGDEGYQVFVDARRDWKLAFTQDNRSAFC
jgi:hypothetical protein